jgi:hypothetical protein
VKDFIDNNYWKIDNHLSASIDDLLAELDEF